MRTGTALLRLAVLVGGFAAVAAAQHDHSGGEEGHGHGHSHDAPPPAEKEGDPEPTYWNHDQHQLWLRMHVMSMILAWVIAMPVGAFSHPSRRPIPLI
jgi:hypothetical protein